MGLNPADPDLDEMWRELGLKIGEVDFNDGSPLEAIRVGITKTNALRDLSEVLPLRLVKLAGVLLWQHPICPIGSDRALHSAIFTTPARRDLDLMMKLDAIARRVLSATPR